MILEVCFYFDHVDSFLAAKEAGEAGTRKEASFSSRSSEFHDRSRPGAFTGEDLVIFTSGFCSVCHLM